MTEHECSCVLRSPEDFDGPAEDCPEHGNPQVLGYCPLGQYETWRTENDRLREERDEARQQCTEQEQQHAFAMEEARGRLAQADKAYAQLLADRNRLREELAAPDQDPARIDRLLPEFTAHASAQSIDLHIQRAQRQEHRWHLRVERLISLRAARIRQRERGEWPAAGVRQDGTS